jgi:hypothetical protein
MQTTSSGRGISVGDRVSFTPNPGVRQSPVIGVVAKTLSDPSRGQGYDLRDKNDDGFRVWEADGKIDNLSSEPATRGQVAFRKISITCVEGPDSVNDERVFTGARAEEQADEFLRVISNDAPRHGGYFKTDVVVFIGPDNVRFSDRWDIQHHSCKDPDITIREHVRNVLLYSSDPAQIPWIAADPQRLECALNSTSADGKVYAECLLKIIDAAPAGVK